MSQGTMSGACHHGVDDDAFCMSCCREGEGKGLSEEERRRERERAYKSVPEGCDPCGPPEPFYED